MTTSSRSTRAVRLVRPPDEHGVGVFCVRAGDGQTYYTFREIPCVIGGRGYVVHKLGLGNRYHVRVGTPEECSCECLGFLRHGHCRHILGLLTLVQHGRL